ncbi:hypothetical protein [Arthrobacter sp. UYCo732]|uniref:hypothetical protein n=1 Tax=Arthrobacter sp. UYCo732 TaxID=3156336 RepID=UPI0033912C20
MIQLLMAAALAILAAARLPVLIRNRQDTVFGAAVLAGCSALLTNTTAYSFVDLLLGGINLARLLMQMLMVLGLWALRKAVLDAVAPTRRRRALVRGIPLFLALGLQTTFFLLLGPTTTTTTWGDDHEGSVIGALFSVVGIAFISWVCGEIAVVCFKVIPGMRGVFRPGFTMVAVGCAIGSITMASMTAGVISAAYPPLAAFNWKSPDGYRALELLSIALVGIGLTLTAVTGHRRRVRIARWEREAFASVEPIREDALRKAGLQRTLESDSTAPLQDRLHRMIVEIWDADLAFGERSLLTAEQRAYLLQVEQKLELEHAG